MTALAREQAWYASPEGVAALAARDDAIIAASDAYRAAIAAAIAAQRGANVAASRSYESAREDWIAEHQRKEEPLA